MPKIKVNENLFGFHPSTQGEFLFQHIAKQFIPSEAKSQVYQLSHLQIGNRQDDLAEYYIGVYCFNLMARLIKKAVHLIEDYSLNQEQQQPKMKRYLQTQMEIAIDRQNKEAINKLISLSLSAALSTRKQVNPSTKLLVTPKYKPIYCYICDRKLELLTEDITTQVQYEHIWPRNFGGDSTAENLLPACALCNHAKGSTLLWQDAHVHSFVLSPSPTAEDLNKGIQYKMKIAMHRRNIFRRACDDQITLKEAALKVGAMGKSIKHKHPDDAVDFFNCTI
ncbi:HNH endonuclease [Candidatus Nitrotoga sp. HW29]|jgi:5-methylcytosine-specific restriction endonuclease McrA|uniref:HNH endonuclease n=1 Tax=Candidatus Nitrotoga sp. HW29 TaxID=2886963 RepID=UPI000E385260|nr:HNH endonuclease [Candidatus Nitrotoga sp. HW29]RFC31745.1 MAG: HNH endonuclease [Candidatus Nitrotoga sp. SPKER]CAH1905041.1 HNH endonuclease [Candidatus Nitrotoga sp. HW29]